MSYLRHRRRGIVSSAALGALAAAGLAAGCAAPGPAAPGTVAPGTVAPGAGSRGAAGAAAGTTIVTILSGADTSVSPGNAPVRPDDSGMYAELVDWWNKYEEPVTKIHVVLDTVSGAATAEHSEMLADAQSGDTRFDIYNLDNEWVPEFAAGHYIRSLRGQFDAAGFLKPPLGSGIYD